MNKMNILPLKAFADNYIWLIINQEKETFTCVDPGDANPVLAYAQSNQLKLHAILLTHHHADHTGGVVELQKRFPHALIYGVDYINSSPIKIANYEFQVIETPGHTKTHRCYYEPDQHLLFCGDTLFSAGWGRVFDGTLEALYNSLNLLADLPNETKVYCAHEYTRHNLAFAASIEPKNLAIQEAILKLDIHPEACSLPSTIGKEKQINPFLHTHNSLLKSFATSRQLNPHDAFALFKQLREEKNQF